MTADLGKVNRKTSDRDPPRQHSAPRPNIIQWKLVRLVDGVRVAVPAWQLPCVSDLQDMVGHVSETIRGNGKPVLEW